jgi:hypothetical protein
MVEHFRLVNLPIQNLSDVLGGSIVMGIPQSLGELEWNILYNG